MAIRRDISPRIRKGITIAGITLLTPIIYFAYVVSVKWFLEIPLNEEPLLSTMMLLWILVLSLTGGVASLGWVRGLRVGPAVGIGGLLLLPWGLPPVVGSIGDISFVFVGLLLVAVAEGAVRFPGEVDRLFGDSAGRYALAAGLFHFAVGFGIQIYVRRFFWMDASLAGVAIYGIIYLVSGLALVATGALPVILWKRRRLVTPAILTAGWLLWGLYGTWQLRGALPWGAFEGVDWISLQPSPDYMLQWTVLVIALLVVGGGESLLRSVGAVGGDGTAPG